MHTQPKYPAKDTETNWEMIIVSLIMFALFVNELLRWAHLPHISF